MKTIFVLEDRDLQQLSKGLPFAVQIGNGEVITLQAERNGSTGTPRANNGTPRRRLSDAERQAILRDVATLGVKAASRKHHLDSRTLYRWQKKGKSNGKASNGHGAVPPLKTGERRMFTAAQRKTIMLDAEKLGITPTLRKYGLSGSVLSNWKNGKVGKKKKESAK